MMDQNLNQARERYKTTELPTELPFAVASAIRRGERRRAQRVVVGRGLTGLVAACACFVLLVNTSPTFALAVSDVPVLGRLAHIFTVVQFSEHDETKLLDVRLPALTLENHSDLEQRINTEIVSRIDFVLAEARARAALDRQAFLDTGGHETEFIPVNIEVDYEVTCQNDRYLSFVLTTTETQANAYTQFYTYNIDLETGKEFTLGDLLGPDWKELCNTAVLAGIAQRVAEDPNNAYFDGAEGIPGFQTVSEGQRFYLSEAGHPVILFEKYEIAPGYMGRQDFEVIYGSE